VPTQQGNYNYNPAVIDEGNVIKVWWCSGAVSQLRDYIWYEEYDKSTRTWSHLQSVLAPGTNPKDWDTFSVCHPGIVEGSWPGAPGGQNYKYALYYTSTNDALGTVVGNSIGVAFSTDGIRWSDQHASYNPIIRQKIPHVKGTFGAGQAAAWSRGGSAVTLFWTDTTALGPGASRILVANSSDGIHFSSPTIVSQDGGPAYWKSDFVFDETVQPPMVYSSQPINFRIAPVPAKVDTYNFGIYRMPEADLLAGRGHWQQLGIIDTNLTGLPLNFEPGIVRSPSGGVVGEPNKNGIQVMFGGGGQTPDTWRLVSVTLKVGAKPVLPFRRYANAPSGQPVSYWVTTGFVPPDYTETPPNGNAMKPVVLGYLDLNPVPGEVPLYDCQSGSAILPVTSDGVLTDSSADRFVSLDSSCEGANVIGLNGYLFSQQPPGIATQPLYRCRASQSSRYVSQDPKCEGHVNEKLLGYAASS
jgi:hypothetical protein